MHELQITERILAVVLQHAEKAGAHQVVSIRLSIGALSDLENEWVQKFFNQVSKGTIAEKAELKIERTPVTGQCDQCKETFEIKPQKIRNTACPKCGHERFVILSGREYKIEDMEVQ